MNPNRIYHFLTLLNLFPVLRSVTTFLFLCCMKGYVFGQSVEPSSSCFTAILSNFCQSYGYAALGLRHSVIEFLRLLLGDVKLRLDSIGFSGECRILTGIRR